MQQNHATAKQKNFVTLASTILYMEKINLAEKFRLISEFWSPKIAGELNGQMVKLVKFKGPFVWHFHEQEDEMFLVVRVVL